MSYDNLSGANLGIEKTKNDITDKGAMPYPELLTPQEIKKAALNIDVFKLAYSKTPAKQVQHKRYEAIAQAQLAKCKEHEAARIAEERAKLAYQIDHKICSDCDHFDNGCAFMSSDCLWWQSIKEGR